jgi:NAD+ kinase
MKIAIYGREFHSSVIPYVQSLFTFLAEKPVSLSIYADFARFLQEKGIEAKNAGSFTSEADVPQDTQVMLSLGGDGAMLAAVSLVGCSGIPVAGINLGRLGFLANIQKEEFQEAIQTLLDGQYTLEQRALLEVSASGTDLFGQKTAFALNDVTIFKVDSSAMITVHAHLDGALLNDYWADGLIIATPTGSTAYSLSCGGPIIMPGSGNFVITPASPHNLNVRPVVISDNMELKLEMESKSGKYLLTCDSKTLTMDTNQTLTIRKAPFQINLIKRPGDHFFMTLRNKLLWGLDARNY